MATRDLGTHELHAAFNSRHDGLLSCAELAAGIEWLQLPTGGAEAEVHALAVRTMGLLTRLYFVYRGARPGLTLCYCYVHRAAAYYGYTYQVHALVRHLDTDGDGVLSVEVTRGIVTRVRGRRTLGGGMGRGLEQ